MKAASEELYRVLKQQQVMSLPQIMAAIDVSRRTAIRRLQNLGYISSYSHTGRFYTLMEIPTFDTLGLWHYQNIHFSRWGPLKETVIEIVAQGPAGYQHRELVDHLHVRCHNALLELTTAGRLHREKLAEAGPYFYFSCDPVAQTSQIAERHRLWQEELSQATPSVEFPSSPIAPTATIAVVVELLKNPEASPATIAHQVRAYGFELSVADVHRVFRTYELDKKRAL